MENMDSNSCLLILFSSLIILDTVHTVRGTPNFQCYVCSVSTINYRLDTLNPCLANVTSLDPQYCSRNQKYCQVITTLQYGQVLSLERKCTDSCENNCIRYTFALWKVICTDCCNQTECNIHGSVSTSAGDYPLMTAMFILHIVTCFITDIFYMNIPV